MGNGSGPSRLNSRIYTNSWSYKVQSQFRNENLQDLGDSFYGLSRPQYMSTIYYTLSNNGPGAGARARRFGNGGQSSFNNTQFRLY